MRTRELVVSLLLLVLEPVLLFSLSRLFSPGTAALIFLVPHGCCSVAIGLLIHGVLPARYQQPRGAGLLFLFSLSFFLPFVGGAGLVLSLRYGLYRRRDKALPPIQVVPIPDLPYRPYRASASVPGDGTLVGLLRHATVPDKRLTAVMTLRQMQLREGVAILRLALKDPVDEVRLLAYSMLDQREQLLTSRIQELLEQVENPDKAVTAGAQSGPLRRQLAWSYFEISYLGLARGEVEVFMLQAAREHAEAHLRRQQQDAEMFLLLSRILLRQRDPEAARRALRAALTLGMAHRVVLPYLAEAYFQARRFPEVQEVMGQLSALTTAENERTRPLVFDLIEQWTAP